jgi:hypothetical protein
MSTYQIRFILFTKTIKHKDMRMECYLPILSTGCKGEPLWDPYIWINDTPSVKFQLISFEFWMRHIHSNSGWESDSLNVKSSPTEDQKGFMPGLSLYPFPLCWDYTWTHQDPADLTMNMLISAYYISCKNTRAFMHASMHTYTVQPLYSENFFAKLLLITSTHNIQKWLKYIIFKPSF